MKSIYFLPFLIFFVLFCLNSQVSSLEIQRHQRHNRGHYLSRVLRGDESIYAICEKAKISSVCHKLFKSDVVIKVTTTPLKNDEFLTTAEFPTFDSANVIAEFGSGWKKFFEVLQLDTVKIDKTKVMIRKGEKNGIRFSTEIAMFGLSHISLDILSVINAENNVAYWLGISMPFSSMGDLVKAFVGKIKKNTKENESPDANTALSTFDSPSGANMTIILSSGAINFASIADFKPQYLTTYESSSAETAPTLLVQATVNIAQRDNAISRFLLKHFGKDVMLAFTAKLSTTKFNAQMTINNIVFSPRFTLLTGGLILEFAYAKPQEPMFGIQGKLQVAFGDDHKEKLVFSGSIKFKLVSCAFAFDMKGVYREAFTLKRLHFGNLKFSIDISYATGIPTAFEVGGELAFGLECYDIDSKFIGKMFCLQGKAYVGVNLVDPLKNYYYGSISPVNADVFFRALVGSKDKIGVHLPQALIDIFEIPEELKASFAPVTTTLPNLVIPQGFFFKGSIKVFQQITKIELYLKTEEGTPAFKASLEMSKPIDFSPILKISDCDGKKGPKSVIQFDNNGFLGDFDAQVSILGLAVGAKVFLSHEKFEFKISGKIFKIFQASFEVSASLLKLKEREFHIKGEIEIHSVDFIKLVKDLNKLFREKLKAFVQKLKDAGKKFLNSKAMQAICKVLPGCKIKAQTTDASAVEIEKYTKEEKKQNYQIPIVVKKLSFEYNLNDANSKTKVIPINISTSIMEHDVDEQKNIDMSSKDDLKKYIGDKAEEVAKHFFHMY